MNESPLLPPLYELVTLGKTDSVISEAERRAKCEAEEGTLVWALEQTHATTRSGHLWYSPPGNLHCALIIRPHYCNVLSAQLGYVAALGAGAAAAGLLSPMTGLRYQWPNKILINDLVAARVELSVPSQHSDPWEWLVIGLAFNVAHHPPNPEPEAFNSLHASGSPEVTVVQLLEDFSRHFLSWINRWAEEGFAPVRRAYTQRANGIGEVLSVDLGDSPVSGRFVDIDDQGNLVMASSTGSRRLLSMGDYFHWPRPP